MSTMENNADNFKVNNLISNNINASNDINANNINASNINASNDINANNINVSNDIKAKNFISSEGNNFKIDNQYLYNSHLHHTLAFLTSDTKSMINNKLAGVKMEYSSEEFYLSPCEIEGSQPDNYSFTGTNAINNRIALGADNARFSKLYLGTGGINFSNSMSLDSSNFSIRSGAINIYNDATATTNVSFFPTTLEVLNEAVKNKTIDTIYKRRTIMITSTTGNICLYAANGTLTGENLNTVRLYGDHTKKTDISGFFVGKIKAASIDQSSDKRLKNFDSFLSQKESLILLNNLKPLKFFWKEDKNNQLFYGLYAQDVRDILIQNNIKNPSLVNIWNKNLNEQSTNLFLPENDDIEYSINYTSLINPLIVGWQYHEQEIQKLKTKNAELETKLNSLLN